MIDRQERLDALCARIGESSRVSLDTEADSLHAYPEKLCLLQISFDGADEIIDPLAGLDLSVLLELLRDRELIIHGADYDLRLLFRTCGFVPRRIFDTMWAARLLGMSEFGLTHLVDRYLGVRLEKGPQTMNWARRPLTERMEAYARNDTRYLRPLADLLQSELETKDRVDWFQETCVHVIEEATQVRVADPDRVWRIKGSDRLGRRGLAIVRELWHWREHEARQADKPPYFILSHESVIAIASRLSKGAEVEEVLPHQIRGRRKEHLLQAVRRVDQLKPEEYPRPIRVAPPPLTPAIQQRFNQLKTHRDQWAAHLELEPSLIASRGDLYQFARDPHSKRGPLLNWQRKLVLTPCNHRCAIRG